jgi:hypothetical protein
MHKIGSYSFDGPYDVEKSNFNNVKGIYVIYASNIWLDVGETDNLGERIPNHERKNCWKSHANNEIVYLLFLAVSDYDQRLEIESALRERLKPACGDR